ncbi:MAG: hypothetical protein H6672_01780 [Anaerolineaceae bacterium]|nr:hypothetical protein [Anaerolineaceae bacterium]
MKRGIIVTTCFSLLSVAAIIVAQDSTCPVMVSDALAAVDSLCIGTGRNQVCYGSATLTTETQGGVTHLRLNAPGDLVDAANIQSLQLTGVDEAAIEWGMALMKLQINLPETPPDQNVTFLLFGDVSLTSATSATNEGYTPMQAFYFRSGMGDSPCAEAPESGILIQAPEGVDGVKLVVDEVRIQLGTTIFLQAAPGDALHVSVIEGQATISAFGETQTVPAGTRISVPIGENLAASGPPGALEPHAQETIDGVLSMIERLSDAIIARPVIETGEESFILEASNCLSEPGRVYELAANQVYTVTTLPGCWLTMADTVASEAEVSITLTVDDIPTGTFIGFGPVRACAPEDGGYNFEARYEVGPLPPGLHTLRVIINYPGGRAQAPEGSTDPGTGVETCTVQAH